MEGATRYHPSPDQLALANTIEESVAALLPLARLHCSHEESDESWSSLEEIGIFAITASEEEGGSGLGAVEESLIAMALGRHLVAPAVTATLGAAHATLDRGAPELRGRRIAAGFRRGDRIIVVQQACAEYVLVRDSSDSGLHAMSAEAPRPIDSRLWLAALTDHAALGEPLARFDASALLRLRLIDAAMLAGIAQTALDMSVAYAGMREQFGRPIGSFQAIKHHCANMAIAARCARDQTSFAAVAVDDGRDDAALQVECAFWVAGSAALENAGKNIQIHGGMGFSDEADPHLVLKRARLLIAVAGGLEAANRRVADAKAAW
ncbi:MAG TPA: acyl-CoA dehydrogenase family protein [Steroidobacteraceae bacterium]|nr:acyl-CoA dehydrogenase family protein [Steroidobacteraceae bacterium]